FTKMLELGKNTSLEVPGILGSDIGNITGDPQDKTAFSWHPDQCSTPKRKAKRPLESGGAKNARGAKRKINFGVELEEKLDNSAVKELEVTHKECQ
ncbi:hypothetical protein SK128_011816, partial [Halocaridina rubra]